LIISFVPANNLFLLYKHSKGAYKKKNKQLVYVHLIPRTVWTRIVLHVFMGVPFFLNLYQAEQKLR